MKKIEVIANDEFTRAAQRVPVENCARVTVITTGGTRLVGESIGGKSSHAKSGSHAPDDAAVMEKFRGLCEDTLGAARVNALLERLSTLESLENVAVLPAMMVLA
jgi:hypothetical protein